MASVEGNSSLIDNDSDEDDFEWEEVNVDIQPQPGNIEITLDAPQAKKKRNIHAISHAERVVRIDCHKIHTICLLTNAWIRNKWINDPLLHARVLSLAPMSLQNAFASIHKSRVPDPNQRGRLFESAITQLAQWWSGTFFSVTNVGHIRSRTFGDVQSLIKDLSDEEVAKLVQEDDEVEVIRNEKSLMKHLLMRSGSRDTSAQLFTALCRALGIPARLVVSIQSVPWRASVGKSKPKYVKKKTTAEVEIEESEMEKVDVKGKGRAFEGEGQRLDGKKVKGKEKAKPNIKLRKSKGQKLGSASPRLATPDPTTTPPVFWTEVFSRSETRWLPVDPIRCIVNRRKAFDPSPAPSAPLPAIYSVINPNANLGSSSRTIVPATRIDNRMVYVLAFEEDGYARDVTPRYAREYNAKVAKAQAGGGKGKGRMEWWERVVGTVRRPYRLHRDDVEDEELQNNQLTEAMPTTVTGFKDHPLYVLPRHLKRDEVIHPLNELGKFRGEPVYARGSVIQLKSSETWIRLGRCVREGEQPMKHVKARAGTVGGMRALEVAGVERTDEVMQGLYARSQTELHIPEPIVDGKIPKNDFGNIDLYVPSMLPAGGAHIPFKRVAKIARTLGVDYAEAVTGFEFKKRRAFPVIEGVVVAAENEAVVLEAYWEAEQDAEEKAREKRKERVLKHWTRLVQGLRIRQRLQEQYAEKPQPEARNETENGPEANSQPGGFLIEADDVVEAFHLPKYLHNLHPSPSGQSSQVEATEDKVINVDTPIFDSNVSPDVLNDDQGANENKMKEIGTSEPFYGKGQPKSMRELAEDAARRQAEEKIPMDPEEYSPPPTPELANGKVPRATPSNGSTTKDTTANERPKRGSASRKRGRKESNLDLEAAPTPQKRVRSSVVPPPTRVLRSRKTKSAADIQAEWDREEAYRNAVAE